MQLILEIPANIGHAESAAIVHAVERLIAVMSHGALKGYDGKFVEQGYDVQLNHLEDHLRLRGKIDEDSGLPHTWLALGRLALTCELEEMGR